MTDIVDALYAGPCGADNADVGETMTTGAVEIEKLRAHIAALEAENKELEAVFETKWAAEQRAIKAWQKKTGKDMTWPDHAKLVEWLLDELDAARAAMEGKD